MFKLCPLSSFGTGIAEVVYLNFADITGAMSLSTRWNDCVNVVRFRFLFHFVMNPVVLNGSSFNFSSKKKRVAVNEILRYLVWMKRNGVSMYKVSPVHQQILLYIRGCWNQMVESWVWIYQMEGI